MRELMVHSAVARSLVSSCLRLRILARPSQAPILKDFCQVVSLKGVLHRDDVAGRASLIEAWRTPKNIGE